MKEVRLTQYSESLFESRLEEIITVFKIIGL